MENFSPAHHEARGTSPQMSTDPTGGILQMLHKKDPMWLLQLKLSTIKPPDPRAGLSQVTKISVWRGGLDKVRIVGYLSVSNPDLSFALDVRTEKL